MFNTHFYIKLVEEGIKAVCGWTRNKGKDIFSTKMLILPVDKHLHWPLCVVFNPGSVMQFTDSDDIDAEVPFMLILDPLDCHSRKEICQNLHS